MICESRKTRQPGSFGSWERGKAGLATGKGRLRRHVSDKARSGGLDVVEESQAMMSMFSCNDRQIGMGPESFRAGLALSE